MCKAEFFIESSLNAFPTRRATRATLHE